MSGSRGSAGSSSCRGRARRVLGHRHGFVSLSSPRPVAVCRVAGDVKLAADLVWLCEKRYKLPPRWSSPGSAHLGESCATGRGHEGAIPVRLRGPGQGIRPSWRVQARGQQPQHLQLACGRLLRQSGLRRGEASPSGPASASARADCRRGRLRLIHDRYAARPARCCRGCEVRPCLLVRAGQPVLRTVSVTVRSLGRLDTWTHGHVADIVGAAGSKRRHLRRSAAIWCE